MCVVSAISDYGQKYIWPGIPGSPSPYTPTVHHDDWQKSAAQPIKVQPPQFTAEEVKKIKEFLKLIELAKKIDETTGQPDCPSDDKIAFLKNLETIANTGEDQ